MQANIHGNAVSVVQPSRKVHRDGEPRTWREFIGQGELHLSRNLRVLAPLGPLCAVPEVGPTPLPTDEGGANQPPRLSAVVVRLPCALAYEPLPGSIGGTGDRVPAIRPADPFQRESVDGHGFSRLGGAGGLPRHAQSARIAKACPSGRAPLVAGVEGRAIMRHPPPQTATGHSPEAWPARSRSRARPHGCSRIE